MATLTVHADRLLPAEPGVRTIARRLYEAVRDLPIVSPHGHVDPRILLDDEPFADPADLFIQPDHYVTRLLHAGGVGLDRLGVGEGPLPEDRAREAWRLLWGHWHPLRRPPVGPGPGGGGGAPPAPGPCGAAPGGGTVWTANGPRFWASPSGRAGTTP